MSNSIERPPARLNELPAWLEAHPFCELTNLFGNTELLRFLRAADGGLWFSGETREHYLPIRCGMAGDRSETGVEITPTGFSLTIHIRYLAGQEQEEPR